MANPDQDTLHRFLFDDSDIRGEIISLTETYRAVLAEHRYPASVRTLIGEFLAAAALVSAALKFNGTLTLQARGNGRLALIMADCTGQQNLRAIASFRDSDHCRDHDIRKLIGEGYLAITLDPVVGQRYQGIVPLDHPKLANCLIDYFERSVQLPTQIWLSADGNQAGGLFLHALPVQLQTLESRQSSLDELSCLADSLSRQEQTQLNHGDQLHRLFHAYPLRLFAPATLKFACTCSRQRTANMLISLGEAEISRLLADTGKVAVQCEFCLHEYRFTPAEAQALFVATATKLH